MVKELVVSSTGTRANHVKVKTGCVTCKTRHVKCDEQKPECFRCRRTGHKCGGYSVMSHDKYLNNPGWPSTSVNTPGSFASYSIPFDFPGSGRERRSFHYFRIRTVPDLSGYFHSDFWERLILQFCHAEPAIRHALIALGAVHETFNISGDHAARGGQEKWDRRFSLQQYNRAISKLRKHLSTKGHQSVVVALICCLLFICFESLLGNHESTLCHLESGLDILRGWRARNVWLPSSESDLIEDHLVQVFCRLDMQATFLLDTRIPQFPRILPICKTEATDFVNIRFAGLTEARNMLEKIGNQLAYFKVLNQLDPDRPSETTPSAIIIEQAKIDARLQGWSRAFDDLLGRMGTTMSTNELRGAILLKMHRKTMALLLASGESVSARAAASFTGTFAEITSLAESLFKSRGCSDESPTFALDLGVIASLYMAARKCCDATIRQHAISLLYTSARREALWNGDMVAKVAERVEAETDRMVPGGVLELAQRYGVTE